MNVSVGSHHFRLSLAAVAGITLGAVAVLHFGGSSVELDRWLASGKQELATDRAFRAQTATWQAQAATARAEARRLRSATDQASARVQLLADSLARLTADTATRRAVLAIGAACQDAMTLCQRRGDSLAVADSLEHLRAENAVARAGRADSLLRVGLQVRECRFLHFFGCPSRQASFILGAGVGAAGAIVAGHR